MVALNDLNDLLIEQLRDIYNAEGQLTKALPKMAKAATNPELRSAFEKHLAQTEEHVNRLEKVLALIETKRAGATPQPGVEKRKLAPVVDLMTALKQSIAEKERGRPTLVPAKATAAKKASQRAGKEGARPRKQPSTVDMNYKPRRLNKAVELLEDGQIPVAAAK